MHRIILHSIPSEQERITVKDQNLRYLRDVLRCSPGEHVLVLDGRGLSLKTVVVEVRKERVTLEPLGTCILNTESRLNLRLIQGILKGDRMDIVVQKVTELGVKEIYPVVTERTQLRYSRKTDHWRRVAEEATRQSGRLLVPVVHDVEGLPQALNRLEGDSVRIFFYEGVKESIKNLTSMFHRSVLPDTKVIYMTGPEGGFSEREVRLIRDEGFLVAGIGRRILRAETAAIAGAILLQFLYGDL